jgi:type II secretory pathway pseudopilin PulG
MKFFTKNEAIGVGVILSVIVVISFFNFRVSLRRARDAQRRADLGAISNALHEYKEDYGFVPPATDEGKILACKGNNFDEVMNEMKELEKFDRNIFFSGLRACEWGQDGLLDLTKVNTPSYIKIISRDPHHDQGTRYLYLSNLNRFQIYAYLEGEESEDGYSKMIVERVLKCGDKICNFGKSLNITPVEISIEEYELQLQKEK